MNIKTHTMNHICPSCDKEILKDMSSSFGTAYHHECFVKKYMNVDME